ncbi:MAG: glycosyltransferase [Syntrophomonadaceae bacterium]|nr:glycosyltransferase [Syntrophomonadaceae bacterium]
MARKLQGVTIQHINSAAEGGGVAELLQRLVPLMRSVGLKVQWEVITGKPEFYQVTKAFHNSFHGQPINFTREMAEIYLEANQRNRDLVDPQADIVVIHDQQPLGLTEMVDQHPGQWIWYCHIDPTLVDREVWDFLSPFARKCHASIYHLEEYAKNLQQQQFFFPPGIDPLSEKNREITLEEQREIIERLDLPQDQPFILQVSRFDRLKDPMGLVRAFRNIKTTDPCYLVLAGGGAADDPEGLIVLEELRDLVQDDPTIKIYCLPPSSHLAINVLQRTAAAVVQNSQREGFGLTVTEALWKEKPVVTRPVGGLRLQVKHGETGFCAETEAELSYYLRLLLQDAHLAQRLGANGKEYVRKNFILPVYLHRWLRMLEQILEQ